MAAPCNKKRLYVGKLTQDVTEKILYATFIPFGPIKDVQISNDPRPYAIRGAGFVEYEDEDDAKEAIDNLNQSELFGQVLRVCVARPHNYMLGSNKPVWTEIDNAREEITPSSSTGH